ncbi:hypothetical protein GE253_25280 [Niveispirillum sp. SYP-B3756]|uniref:hypothetical protein n=1 Tax=Niveispirillum sp. SYP-B3756 TaxID=2662178 RepID=UPI0012915909|nr:hypothetical protein [Niveispirillum sp. SYP-B3756]MQP68628.1 hypothetical protein [Niveispirillum sp. SYP-B3756]
MALIRHWRTILLVAAGCALLLGANLHLIMVALESQPACVPHQKPGVKPATTGYTAAKSAC